MATGEVNAREDAALLDYGPRDGAEDFAFNEWGRMHPGVPGFNSRPRALQDVFPVQPAGETNDDEDGARWNDIPYEGWQQVDSTGAGSESVLHPLDTHQDPLNTSPSIDDDRSEEFGDSPARRQSISPFAAGPEESPTQESNLINVHVGNPQPASGPLDRQVWPRNIRSPTAMSHHDNANEGQIAQGASNFYHDQTVHGTSSRAPSVQLRYTSPMQLQRTHSRELTGSPQQSGIQDEWHAYFAKNSEVPQVPPNDLQAPHEPQQVEQQAPFVQAGTHVDEARANTHPESGVVAPQPAYPDSAWQHAEYAHDAYADQQAYLPDSGVDTPTGGPEQYTHAGQAYPPAAVDPPQQPGIAYGRGDVQYVGNPWPQVYAPNLHTETFQPSNSNPDYNHRQSPAPTSHMRPPSTTQHAGVVQDHPVYSYGTRTPVTSQQEVAAAYLEQQRQQAYVHYTGQWATPVVGARASPRPYSAGPMHPTRFVHSPVAVYGVPQHIPTPGPNTRASSVVLQHTGTMRPHQAVMSGVRAPSVVPRSSYADNQAQQTHYVDAYRVQQQQMPYTGVFYGEQQQAFAGTLPQAGYGNEQGPYTDASHEEQQQAFAGTLPQAGYGNEQAPHAGAFYEGQQQAFAGTVSQAGYGNEQAPHAGAFYGEQQHPSAGPSAPPGHGYEEAPYAWEHPAHTHGVYPGNVMSPRITNTMQGSHLQSQHTGSVYTQRYAHARGFPAHTPSPLPRHVGSERNSRTTSPVVPMPHPNFGTEGVQPFGSPSRRSHQSTQDIRTVVTSPKIAAVHGQQWAQDPHTQLRGTFQGSPRPAVMQQASRLGSPNLRVQPSRQQYHDEGRNAPTMHARSDNWTSPPQAPPVSPSDYNMAGVRVQHVRSSMLPESYETVARPETHPHSAQHSIVPLPRAVVRQTGHGSPTAGPSHRHAYHSPLQQPETQSVDMASPTHIATDDIVSATVGRPNGVIEEVTDDDGDVEPDFFEDMEVDGGGEEFETFDLNVSGDEESGDQDQDQGADTRMDDDVESDWDDDEDQAYGRGKGKGKGRDVRRGGESDCHLHELTSVDVRSQVPNAHRATTILRKVPLGKRHPRSAEITPQTILH